MWWLYLDLDLFHTATLRDFFSRLLEKLCNGAQTLFMPPPKISKN
jgi:hypothetical protein